MNELFKANAYIARTKKSVNGKYRLRYHVMPPIGWMNDPNGLIYYGNKYHLYYQFNPYDTDFGKMCWGHVVSDDLISYTDCGVALMHDAENEKAFSGGAIQTDDGITVYYTLHIEEGESKIEEVYMATSADGREFKNPLKVFDNSDLPKNLSVIDFRDPCPAKIGDSYYVFVGGKDIAFNRGVIIVLSGKSPEKMEYKFYLGPYYELGDMGECPSYFKIGKKDVFVVSGCHVSSRNNDFKNINSSVFIVGKIDFEHGQMDIDFIKEIDKGDAFYAPQFVRGTERAIMISWFEMWNKPYPTRDMGHGWVGAFTIPREVTCRDGDIFQNPVSELNDYLYEVENGEVPKCSIIEFGFFGEGLVSIEGSNGKVIIGNDGGIYIDTRMTNNSFGSIRRTNLSYGRCEVKVLLDISGIEVFVDGGREVISSRIYIDGNYRIQSSGGVSRLKVKGVGGKQ